MSALYRSDDMRDAHERVINCDAEIVDWEAIAAQDDEVSESVCVESHIPSDSVWNENVLVWRHSESVAEGRALHSTHPSSSRNDTAGAYECCVTCYADRGPIAAQDDKVSESVCVESHIPLTLSGMRMSLFGGTLNL